MTQQPITKHNNRKYYNWYAGNHCYPKCSNAKIILCKEEIRKLIENIPVQSHKDFVYLIRSRYRICNLSPADYVRNVYKEPLCMHRYKQALEKMDEKEKQLFYKLEELTLLLLWLSSWKEEVIRGEFVQKSWKNYDFNILDSLLDKKYISYSYKAKSVQFLDKGIEKAKELVKKYKIDL